MRWIAPALLLFCAPVHAATCDLNAITTALEASLADMKPKEIEVSDVQSTEGGVWNIYREKDGRLNTIVRIDGGESGKNETRLSVANRKTWGAASTRFDYIRHAFADDGSPFAYVKKTTDYYYFCDGRLYTANPTWSTVGEEYVTAAAGVKDTFFKAKEIAEVVKGLAK